MIARVEITYDGAKRLRDLIKEQGEPLYHEMCKRLMPTDHHTIPELERAGSYDYAWSITCLIDLDTDGLRLAELGVEYTVKNFKGTMRVAQILPNGTQDTTQNNTIFIQVPHIGLMQIDEVKVVEDYCTNMLQDELNAGWRILCVCPPNAQRRPDYIMGRTKERS